jgi:hypothetical protein
MISENNQDALLA